MTDNHGHSGRPPEGQPQQPGPPQQPQQGQWPQQPGQQPAQQPGPPQQGPPPVQPQQGQWPQQSAPPSGPQWQGQPGYGGPQQPSQPGPGGQGGGVNKGLLVGILALVLLVIGGIIAAVIILGGDDKDDDDKSGGDDNNSSAELSPVETVEALVQASEDGDCEAVRALMVDGDTFPCDQLLGNAEDYELKSAEEKSVDGDKAVVATEYVQSGRTGTEDFPLTKVDGVWLVDLSDEGGSDSGSTDGSDSAEVAPSSGSHPLMLMDEFTAAIKANDCEAAKELLLDPASADCSEITTDDAENVEFGSPKLVSDGAEESTVSSEMTIDGSAVGTFTVNFVLDDGEWKIDNWNY